MSSANSIRTTILSIFICVRLVEIWASPTFALLLQSVSLARYLAKLAMNVESVKYFKMKKTASSDWSVVYKVEIISSVSSLFYKVLFTDV